MTKFQKGLLSNYESARHETLWQAYGNPSDEKRKAYKNCQADMRWMNGYAQRIPSRNTWQFTFAFKYDCDEDGKTHLRYHTANHLYDFAIN